MSSEIFKRPLGVRNETQQRINQTDKILRVDTTWRLSCEVDNLISEADASYRERPKQRGRGVSNELSELIKHTGERILCILRHRTTSHLRRRGETSCGRIEICRNVADRAFHSCERATSHWRALCAALKY